MIEPTLRALILVAGGPGAGKTSLGRALARAIPSSVLLDKDVVAGPWLDPVLMRLNDGVVDRDSRVYWDELRPLEYASLMAAAYDNLEVGKTPIVVAPFGPELRDAHWIDQCRQRTEAAGARLLLTWITVDAADARMRIAERDDARDRWKLANWDRFAATEPYALPAALAKDGPPAHDEHAAKDRHDLHSVHAAQDRHDPHSVHDAHTRVLVLHNDRPARIDEMVDRVLERLR